MRKGYRKIVVCGMDFEYKVGKTMVDIRGLGHDYHEAGNFPELTGMTWNDIERARHKGNFSITPKMIAKIIESEIPTEN